MGSQRLGSCSGTLNCSWHFLPWSCAGDVAWSRNVQVVPFPLLSSLPALLGWSESQRRTLGEACRGQHLLVSEQPRVGEDWFESKRDQESAHSSYSSLLGNMMEENTCVCLGWGLRGGGGGWSETERRSLLSCQKTWSLCWLDIQLSDQKDHIQCEFISQTLINIRICHQLEWVYLRLYSKWVVADKILFWNV